MRREEGEEERPRERRRCMEREGARGGHRRLGRGARKERERRWKAEYEVHVASEKEPEGR